MVDRYSVSPMFFRFVGKPFLSLREEKDICIRPRTQSPNTRTRVDHAMMFLINFIYCNKPPSRPFITRTSLPLSRSQRFFLLLFLSFIFFVFVFSSFPFPWSNSIQFRYAPQYRIAEPLTGRFQK
ncbi:hypothetical protein N657DRAFT_62625 [Parathielavia appendiculata]|uniref:Transmembrane protein n=1 Tax=Parathielavia appendiculata TaxID=2587402 RepID=A0AAN6UA35_9PEZI|nr:hypothetical protein N657DRAFT_62625 [Parathielavia appendiculata]